jgi:hypothetical protein
LGAGNNACYCHAAAKPQAILQLMSVDGLTAEHIKSHLQVSSKALNTFYSTSPHRFTGNDWKEILDIKSVPQLMAQAPFSPISIHKLNLI